VRETVVPGAELLVVEGAGFRYPEGGGVRDLSLTLRAGETVALLGPNGAGKSTALRLCIGLLSPQEGTVRLSGGDPAARGPHEVAKLAGMLFQDPDDQIFNARVDAEIGWTLKVRGMSEEEREPIVLAVMRELGLEGLASAHPHELSRSTRQLIALASTLVAEPSVLFLDEPTTALDEAGAALAFAAVERRRVAGSAVVVVTHDDATASRWADRVVRLEDGRLTEGRM
jgi:energy-coupling factor transport system ATP-binding protein